jgi:hypothetical protein
MSSSGLAITRARLIGGIIRPAGVAVPAVTRSQLPAIMTPEI